MPSLKKFLGGSGKEKAERDNETATEQHEAKLVEELQVQDDTPTAHNISTTGRIGLDVLHEPDEGANLDIVFVHGITGNRETTWTWKGQGRKVFWPKDFLRLDLPKARIMTFGYDADVIHFWNPLKTTSRNNVEGHGTNLARVLMSARERSDSDYRNLILVGHSLGGLVIESALVISKDSQDPHLRKINECTRGVVFLGTPHYGSDHAKWAQYGASLVGIFRTVPRDLLSTLERESQMLESIENRFANLRMGRPETNAGSLKIVCFYEEKAIPGIGMIVPKSSAAFYGSEPQGINATHVGMTRFNNRNDPGYDSISSALFILARDLGRESNVVKSGHPTSMFDMSSLATIIPPVDDNGYKVDFLLPRHVVAKFVPRSDEMSKIVRSLGPDDKCHQTRRHIFVLHGLGGTGKTQLMLEYARSNKLSYTAVFWLNGATHSLLRQSMVDEASRISSIALSEAFREYSTARQELPVIEDPFEISKAVPKSEKLQDNIIATFLRWLNAVGNSKWLLLIDNVDKTTRDQDAYDVERYFPRSDHGSIIITSRHLPLCDLGDSLTLTTLAEDQGLQILAHRTGLDLSDLPQDAKKLVKRLGGLPLALAQAGAFIKNGVSFQEYITLYDTKWKEIMGVGNDASNAKIKDYAHGTVGATWSVSYEYIKKRDSMASTMVDVLAYYQGSDIYYELFRINEEQTLEGWKKPPPKFVEEVFDPSKFQRMIRLLVEFSFLQPKPKRDGYEMHPVLQDWCLFSKTESERDEISVLALRIIGSSAKRLDNIYWQLAMSRRERLSPHVSRCLEYLDGRIETRVGDLANTILFHFNTIGWMFSKLDKKEDCLKSFERAFAGMSVRQGDQNIQTQWFATGLAHQYIRQDKIVEAESMLEHVISENPSIFSPSAETEFQLLMLNLLLAKAYAMNGKAKEAERIFRQVISVIPSAKGSAKSSQMFAEGYLGDFFSEQGRHSEAAEVYSKMVPVAQALGPKLTYWELVCKKLGDCYLKLRRLEDREKVFLETVKYFESTYGIEDDWTLAAMKHLGENYTELKKFEKAEEQFRHILMYELSENTRKWEVHHLLADNLRRQRKFEESEKVFIKTLAGRECELGVDHLDSLHTKYGISLLFEDTGRFEEAEQSCRQALGCRLEMVEDEEDPLTLSYLHALGSFLRQQGKYQEAEKIQVKVLKSRERKLGMKDLDTLTTKHLLCLTLGSLKKYGEAARMARETYRDRSEVLGKANTDTLASGQALSRILWFCEGYQAEAVGIAENLLIIAEESFGPDNKEIVGPLFLLGYQYGDLKRYFDAEELYRRSLKIEEKELGPYHKDVAQTLLQLGQCLKNEGKFREAADILQRFCNIMYDHLKAGPESLEASDGLYWLGYCRFQQEPPSLDAARAAFEKCIEYRKASLNMEHIAILRAICLLAAVHEKKGDAASTISNLAPIADKLITSTSVELASSLINDFQMLGEAYWNLGQHQNAQKSYRRILATLIIKHDDIDLLCAIRGGMDHATIQTWLEERAYISLETSFEEGMPYICCDGCSPTAPLQGPFSVCLICKDIALCGACMARFQKQGYTHIKVPGQFPSDEIIDEYPTEADLAVEGCEPSHDFLEVPRASWGPTGFIKGQVSGHGMPFEAWFEDVKADFLAKMAKDDPLWMSRLVEGEGEKKSPSY